jgi:lysophospholipase L1-like esterase
MINAKRAATCFAGMMLLWAAGCVAPKLKPRVDLDTFTRPVRVACVGDSITYGAGIKNRDASSYPAVLGGLLGAAWEVRNFGVSGATMLRDGDKPYWQQAAYEDATAFRPDVVVIKLGTNDSKPQNWDEHGEKFVRDYVSMIEHFKSLPSAPQIWVCLPVPVYQERWGIRVSTVRDEVIPAVREAAGITQVPVVNLYQVLSNRAEYFPDGVHPDARGAGAMAHGVQLALIGRL